MSGPSVALVTGANKGIGDEIAQGLGATGATVPAGARDAERGVAAAGRLAAEGRSMPRPPTSSRGRGRPAARGPGRRLVRLVPGSSWPESGAAAS
jgi:NAD(P)-dependent dehydrogenase (short-subunit alcohol dehydrogenase family)